MRATCDVARAVKNHREGTVGARRVLDAEGSRSYKYIGDIDISIGDNDKIVT